MIGEEHDQPVDTDTFSRGRRHAVFQGAQEIFIHQMGFFIACRPLRRLSFEPFPLIQRIVQLGKGIGDLPAGDVELEAIGQGRVRILAPREEISIG